MDDDWLVASRHAVASLRTESAAVPAPPMPAFVQDAFAARRYPQAPRAADADTPMHTLTSWEVTEKSKKTAEKKKAAAPAASAVRAPPERPSSVAAAVEEYRRMTSAAPAKSKSLVSAARTGWEYESSLLQHMHLAASELAREVSSSREPPSTQPLLASPPPPASASGAGDRSPTPWLNNAP